MKRLIALIAFFIPAIASAVQYRETYLFGSSAGRANLLTTTTTAAKCHEPGAYNHRIVIDVDAVAGTNPTLDVTLQHGNGDGVWKTLDTFSQYTSSDTTNIIRVLPHVTHVDTCIRAVLTVGGTDSPEYNVSLKWLYEF